MGQPGVLGWRPLTGLGEPTPNPVKLPPLSLYSPTCKSCKSELPSSGEHASGRQLEVAGSSERHGVGVGRPMSLGAGSESRSLAGWGHRGRVPGVSQGPRERQAWESLVGCGWGSLRGWKRLAPSSTHTGFLHHCLPVDTQGKGRAGVRRERERRAQAPESRQPEAAWDTGLKMG